MFYNDLIGPKLYMNNHWMVPDKVLIFSVDQQSEMAVKVSLIRKQTIYYNLLWKYWVNLIIQDQIWPDMPGIFLIKTLSGTIQWLFMYSLGPIKSL
jgi:hypothetical protein